MRVAPANSVAYQADFSRKAVQSLGSLCFFCLYLWTPSFEGNWVSLMEFSLKTLAGIDGNAPYQAQELQITTLANPGIQTNFLPPRLALS